MEFWGLVEANRSFSSPGLEGQYKRWVRLPNSWETDSKSEGDSVGLGADLEAQQGAGGRGMVLSGQGNLK